MEAFIPSLSISPSYSLSLPLPSLIHMHMYPLTISKFSIDHSIKVLILIIHILQLHNFSLVLLWFSFFHLSLFEHLYTTYVSLSDHSGGCRLSVAVCWFPFLLRITVFWFTYRLSNFRLNSTYFECYSMRFRVLF